MSNSASQKMLDAVSAAKESAKRAEQEYDRGARRLQAKASRNIDLYGGSAVSQVADIASESRKICDALYAAYQTLVKMIDEQCRPLLEQEPDYRAVREVRNIIKWLNDESEIENNFTASLNSRSLGGVASGRYIPLMENKMIQSFWDSKCASWPGRAEAEHAEKLRKEEQKRQRKQEAEAAWRAEEEAYERALSEWSQKAIIIERHRKRSVDDLLGEAKRERKATIKNAYEREITLAAKKREECEQAKAEAEELLATLGLMKFSQKSKAKKTIEEMIKGIETATARIAAAERKYNDELRDFDSWCEKKLKELEQTVVKKFPIPHRPKKPYLIKNIDELPPMTRVNEMLRKETIEAMELGRRYSLYELQTSIPALAELSSDRIDSILKKLDGTYLQRTREGRAYYYQLLDQ